jgi:uncharacterized membrane protein
VACAAACAIGKPEGRPDEPEAATVFRGRAVFGQEVRAFEPCGRDSSLWVVDSTGRLWDLIRELALPGEQRQHLFVMVEGHLGTAMHDGLGSGDADTLHVDEILYGAREGFGCDLDIEAFRFRALGNEPFWSMDLTREGILLRSMGQDTKRWTPEQEVEERDGIRLTGRAEDGDSIIVEMLQRQCRDTMSGAFYGFTAYVIIGESTLIGCAVRGTAG